MTAPTFTSSDRSSSTFTPILLALTSLALYLVSGALVNSRASPPLFFTVGLGLLFAAFVPTLLVSVVAVGTILGAQIFLALDHIHGECHYDVMVGGSSWHKERLGELAWYRQCVQPSEAWWIMVALGLLWLSILFIEVHRHFQLRDKSIYLPIHQADPETPRPSTSD